jgi:hypothetical protein
MSSDTNTSRVLERSSLNRAGSPAHQVIKADGSMKPDATTVLASDSPSFALLTIDDLGGRSDALGG